MCRQLSPGNAPAMSALTRGRLPHGKGYSSLIWGYRSGDPTTQSLVARLWFLSGACCHRVHHSSLPFLHRFCFFFLPPGLKKYTAPLQRGEQMNVRYVALQTCLQRHILHDHTHLAVVLRSLAACLLCEPVQNSPVT